MVHGQGFERVEGTGKLGVACDSEPLPARPEYHGHLGPLPQVSLRPSPTAQVPISS